MAEAAPQGGYNPYGRTLYDPRTAIYAAVEAEDWEPAAPQGALAERRVEIQDAASLDLGVGGWTGWTAKSGRGAMADSAAPESRVPGLISAAAPAAHAAGAGSTAAAASLQQQMVARPAGIMHTASSLPGNLTAAEPSVGALLRPRAERASRFAELLGSDGPQHGQQSSARPAAAAAVPFDAEKAFRSVHPPSIISLKHIASKPPQPRQAEAPVQQARRLADAPPLGTSSSKAEGLASVPVLPQQLLLPAPGTEIRVTRLADAPPLGSQKAAAMQPSGSDAAPSEGRASALRLRSRWGDVQAAAEGVTQTQDGGMQQPASTPAPVTMGGSLAASAAAVPVVGKNVRRAEGRGSSTAMPLPARQKSATRKPTEAQPSAASGSDVMSGGAGAGRPMHSTAEAREGKEGSGRSVPRKQRPVERRVLDAAEVRAAREVGDHSAPRTQSAQRSAGPMVSSPEATRPRPASPAAAARGKPRPNQASKSSSPGTADLPDWMVAEPDWLVAASAALDALPVPFVALPSPLLNIGSVANSGGTDQVSGATRTPAAAPAEDLPPHLLAAHDQLLVVDEAAGVSAGQRPAAAASVNVQPAKRPKPAREKPQQRRVNPEPEVAPGAKPAAKPSKAKASRQPAPTAEPVAPARPAKPPLAAALSVAPPAAGAAARPTSARPSTAGDDAVKTSSTGDAPARRATKAVKAPLNLAKERAAAPAAQAPVAGVSKADAPAPTAVPRPTASQAQRYVPTGRLDQQVATSRALAAKLAGLQAAPRPAPVRVTTWEAAPPPQAPDPNLIITFESSDDDEEDGEVHDAGEAAVPVPASPAEAALDRAAQAAAASGSAPPLAPSAADDALARQMAELRAGASLAHHCIVVRPLTSLNAASCSNA